MLLSNNKSLCKITRGGGARKKVPPSCAQTGRTAPARRAQASNARAQVLLRDRAAPASAGAAAAAAARLAPLRRRSRPRGAALAAAALLGCFFALSLAPGELARRPAAVARATAAAGGGGAGTPPPEGAKGVRLVAVAPLAEASGLGAPWGAVLAHTAQRLRWTNATFSLDVVDAAGSDLGARAAAAAAGADVAVVMGVRGGAAGAAAAALAPALAGVPTVAALGCAPRLAAALGRLGGAPLSAEDARLMSPGVAGDDGDAGAGAGAGAGPALAARVAAAAAALLDGGAARRRREAAAVVGELFGRASSDDLLFSLLVLVNEFVPGAAVPAVAASTTAAGGLPTLGCMLSNCWGEVAGCLASPGCRAALGCLQGCKFNDQVCSYRCIASYESPQLEAFSLCVLQKHRCLGLSADIPAVPDPAPMAAFRGAPLTVEAAEGVFIGWLGASGGGLPGGEEEAWSWKVFAGKNPAYDAFACQYQLFYRGRGRGAVWYRPVFKVLTLDGRAVWRERTYRMRPARGAPPGTFRLSVLDNGVTSDELWRLLDADDGLGWAAFYYAGAASAAGLSYTGAILASRTGEWPAGPAARARIEAALRRAGVEPWELTDIRWDGAEGAPLAARPGAAPPAPAAAA